MYECLVIVDPATDIPVDLVAAELRRFYAGKPDSPSELALEGDLIELRWPGYTLSVGRSSLPHVLEESQGIASEFAGEHPARERIGLCSSRYEVVGEDDREMQHFNDYLFIGEVLARLGTVYRFESTSSQFLE